MEITHLHDVLQHIPINKQNQSVRSNLVQHLMNELDASHCINSNLCLHCGNDFKKFEERHVLVPTKKKNRYLRRLIKQQLDCGTLYQVRSMEKLKKYSVQKLVKCCQFCKFQLREVIRNNQEKKPVKRFKKISMVASESNKNTVKKAKNKKKKDFAGLKTSAVMSAKRAREVANNLDNSPSPKRLRLDTSVIELNTPTISPTKYNKNTSRNISNNSKSGNWEVLRIDQTNSKIGNPDFISLIAPKSINTNNIENKELKNPVIDLITPTKMPEPLDSPDFISLITPKSTKSKTTEIGNEQKVESPDFISLITPKSTKSNTNEISNEEKIESSDFVSLITPKSTTPNYVIDLETRAYKMAIKKNNKAYKYRVRQIKRLHEKKSDSTQNENTSKPQYLKKQDSTTSNNNETRTSPSAKKQNTLRSNKSINKEKKALAIEKSKKNARKLNTLSYLLRDNNDLNKTVSNLELFLNSLPKKE